MNRRAIATSLVLLSAAAFVIAGKPGTVTTIDGERLSGDITETRESVTVVRKGIRTVFPRENVTEIDYSTYAEQFERALLALAADDAEGRLALAREAFEQKEYVLAQRAVDQAIDINPLNRSALELSRAIANQITLESRGKPATSPTTGPTTVAAERASTERRNRGLSNDQINLVRQKELKPDDQVRVQFRNNARKAFVDTQPGLTFREFSALTDTTQALRIIEHGSDELRGDVFILSDPQTVLSFNRKLHTAVIQGCATSQCHGGNNGGNFKLLTGALDSSTVITNFYLLMHYKKRNDAGSDSIFAPVEHRMIERGNAKDSLLYQYSLPRRLAAIKHPQVRKWDGIVISETDRFVQDLETWINKELAPMPPNYGFEFSLLPTTQPAETEKETPATIPTTEPATQPAN